MARRDRATPPWRPAFLRLGSWVYRLEFAAATFAIVILLVDWRETGLGALAYPALFQAVFWAIWPDLAAFLPIRVASKGTRSWPS